jgi:thiol:disulfide interchange protein
MNKIVLYLVILGTVYNMQASHIKWYSNYEKALQVAKKENKPIMLVLRKKDCSECKKIFAVTFRDQEYIDKLNDNYISIVATHEDKNSYPIELFYTLDFPAVFFVNSKDESFISKPIFGYIAPDKLSNYMYKFKEKY